MSASGNHKIKFSKEEDRRLYEIVSILGPCDWELISVEMKTRSARQCRDRWANYLSPKLNTKPFTEEEDLKLIELYKLYGPKWRKISSQLNARPPNTIRNHYKVIARKYGLEGLDKPAPKIPKFQEPETSPESANASPVINEDPASALFAEIFDGALFDFNFNDQFYSTN